MYKLADTFAEFVRVVFFDILNIKTLSEAMIEVILTLVNNENDSTSSVSTLYKYLEDKTYITRIPEPHIQALFVELIIGVIKNPEKVRYKNSGHNPEVRKTLFAGTTQL